MSMKIKIVSTFIILLAFVGLTAIDVSAEENNPVDSVTIYVDDSETEIAKDVVITEDNTSIPSINNGNVTARVSPIFSADVWMSVTTKKGGTPGLSKYWYVRYISGRKYQGYVYWTGESRIKNWGPPPQLEHRFQGTLDLV
jgi:hypothetical protein